MLWVRIHERQDYVLVFEPEPKVELQLREYTACFASMRLYRGFGSVGMLM